MINKATNNSRKLQTQHLNPHNHITQLYKSAHVILTQAWVWVNSSALYTHHHLVADKRRAASQTPFWIIAYVMFQ